MTNETKKTISGVKIKPFRYQFGARRKKIYDLKKERGEVFEHNGKTYVCDGFLPSAVAGASGMIATLLLAICLISLYRKQD